MIKMAHRSVFTLAIKKGVSRISKNITFRHNPNAFQFYMRNPLKASRLFLSRLSMSNPYLQNLQSISSNLTIYFIENSRRAAYTLVFVPVGVFCYNQTFYVPANLSFTDFNFVDDFLRLYRQGILLPTDDALIMQYYKALIASVQVLNIDILRIHDHESFSRIGDIYRGPRSLFFRSIRLNLTMLRADYYIDEAGRLIPNGFQIEGSVLSRIPEEVAETISENLAETLLVSDSVPFLGFCALIVGGALLYLNFSRGSPGAGSELDRIDRAQEQLHAIIRRNPDINVGGGDSIAADLSMVF